MEGGTYVSFHGVNIAFVSMKFIVQNNIDVPRTVSDQNSYSRKIIVSLEEGAYEKKLLYCNYSVMNQR